MTDAAPVIDHDLACCRCEYNLRGLASDGLCPECGSKIELSIPLKDLSAIEKAWLRRAHVAIQLLIAGTLLIAGGPCACGFGASPLAVGLVLPSLVLLSRSAPAALGIPRVAQRCCLLAAIMASATLVPLTALFLAPPTTLIPRSTLDDARFVAIIAIVTFGAAAARAVSLVLAALAKRINRARLAESFGFSAGLAGLAALLGICSPLGIPRGSSAVDLLFPIAGFTIWLWALFSTIQLLLLLSAIDEWVHPPPGPAHGD